jgi:DNA-binding NtrC family response regulator
MRDETFMFLIVDDEPDMCWALQHILKTAGFCSQSALSGLDALDLIRQHQYALAFVDAKLPDMDGLQLAKEIYELAPTTHVVMVSGYFYQDDVTIQKAIQENLITGFISKPFLNDEIIRIIETTGAALCSRAER